MTVVAGIPETAVSRGVYTEQGLRDRFCKVEAVARRVGNIGEEGGSLLRSVDIVCHGYFIYIVERQTNSAELSPDVNKCLESNQFLIAM